MTTHYLTIVMISGIRMQAQLSFDGDHNINTVIARRESFIRCPSSLSKTCYKYVKPRFLPTDLEPVGVIQALRAPGCSAATGILVVR